jgi:bifunctional non-homologous end joining protein LigD
VRREVAANDNPDNGEVGSEVMAESRTAKQKSEPAFAGIALTNPDRVFYPELGLTKLDLARYYEAVASAMLPYIGDRPRLQRWLGRKGESIKRW